MKQSAKEVTTEQSQYHLLCADNHNIVNNNNKIVLLENKLMLRNRKGTKTELRLMKSLEILMTL